MLTIFWWQVEPTVCAICLEQSVRRALPEDIKLEKETLEQFETKHFEYLHCELLFNQTRTVGDDWFWARPQFHNEEFALGKQPWPNVGKLGLFCEPATQRPKDLRVVLWAKFTLAGQVFEWNVYNDQFRKTYYTVGIYVLEALRLGWPLQWICKCLSGWRPFVRKQYCVFVRLLGSKLRGCLHLHRLCKHDGPDRRYLPCSETNDLVFDISKRTAFLVVDRDLHGNPL
jgi:hypothetical protein